ncbi:chromosome segregation protein SMC [Acidithiobacillus sulfuriphilus]|uniref:chromosome segregation protein SMC n=1 Tax=Acidithiobacillus sulfuriphilus TaxID=1867749 RepID=UPI003F613DD2
MRLKAIHLAGFKSFLEPAAIELQANPVVIVGPNGCGKSNTVDAIRWVLGESSARQLRGGSLSDVISNGGGKRPGAQRAVVELHFDNSDGSAPGALAGLAEISVRRELDRRGDSQYRINGGRCRRRDVADLFLGTGLGANAYAIVEQGTIGRIIDARPEDLRNILEEAGAISRYKERRRETAQRIAETRDHLQRLHDIHGEMEAQWGRLQRQAQAARRFRELRAAERRWRWWALQCRLEEEHSAAQAVAEQLAQSRAALERQGAAQALLLGSLQEQRQQQRGLQDAVEGAQAAYYEASARLAECTHQIRDLRAARQRQEEICRQNRDALAKLERDRHTLLQERQRRDASLREGDARLLTLRGEEEAARRERQAEEQALAALETERSTLQAALSERRRERDVATAMEKEQGLRLDDLEKRLMDLAQPLPTEVSRLPELEATVLRGQAAVGATEEALLSAGTAWNSAQESLREARRQRDEAQRELHECTARRRALQALYQRLQKPVPGLGDGPTLLDTLRVAEGWEHAVEQVLGDRLQARVGDGEGLAQTTAGSFLEISPRDRARGGAGAQDQGMLLRQLHLGDGDAGPLQDWLWGLRCAPDLDFARRERDRLAPGEAWITPDGVLVHAGGISFPTTDRDGAGLLQCRRDLSAAAAALDTAQDRAASAETRLNAADEAQRAAQQQRARLDGQLQEERRHLARDEHELARLRSRAEAEQERAGERERERQRLAGQGQQLRERLAAARSQIQTAQPLCQNLERQLAEVEAQIQAARQRLAQKRSQAAHLRDEMQRLEIQRQRLQTELEATVQQEKQMVEREERHRRQRDAAEEQLLIQEAGIPRGEAEYAQAEAAKNACQTNLERLQGEARAIDQEIRQGEGERLAVENAIRQWQAHAAGEQATLATLHGRLGELERQAENLAADLAEDPGPCPEPGKVTDEPERLAALIARMGNVNLAAEEELNELGGRRQELLQQSQDVEEALQSLETAMASMDQETSSRFAETLVAVNDALQELFAILFGGGTALLTPTSDDPIDAGLILRAQPPGKRNATLQQLSGGEKALTAIALVFALFRLNPAPFCVLDEVDAPLDEANVGRFCALLREMAAQTQFLLITHHTLTMQAGEQLIGVTMPEAGVSRIVSVAVEETLAAARARGD